jgi:hypothetical protein
MGAMPNDHQFGLFVEDEKGHLWRGFFDDLEAAKKSGQELANKERLEFFVFNFKDFTEVARVFPARPKPSA